jgi:hypothetical protein
MFGFFRLVGVIVLSHTLYDLMKDDRKEWVSSIRKFVARKWHDAEQRVAGVEKKGE